MRPAIPIMAIITQRAKLKKDKNHTHRWGKILEKDLKLGTVTSPHTFLGARNGRGVETTQSFVHLLSSYRADGNAKAAQLNWLPAS